MTTEHDDVLPPTMQLLRCLHSGRTALTCSAASRVALRAGTLNRAARSQTARSLQDMEKYTKLYETAFEFVCVRTGMDRALTDEAARAEVLAALESVFPLAQMPVYLTLRADERAEQLQARSAVFCCI